MTEDTKISSRTPVFYLDTGIESDPDCLLRKFKLGDVLLGFIYRLDHTNKDEFDYLKKTIEWHAQNERMQLEYLLIDDFMRRLNKEKKSYNTYSAVLDFGVEKESRYYIYISPVLALKLHEDRDVDFHLYQDDIDETNRVILRESLYQPEDVDIEVDVTVRDLNQIQAELMRTGIRGGSDFYTSFEQLPADLTPKTLDAIFTGQTERMKRSSLSYVFKAFAVLPNVPENQRIEITEKMFWWLKYHKERTGVGAHALCRKIEDPLAGLTQSMIECIVNGRARTCHRDCWKVIEKTYARLPDKTNGFYQLSRENISELRRHIARTGKSPEEMFANSDADPQAPTGFDYRDVIKWTDSFPSRAARRDFYFYAIQKYREAPSKEPQPQEVPEAVL